MRYHPVKNLNELAISVLILMAKLVNVNIDVHIPYKNSLKYILILLRGLELCYILLPNKTCDS